MVDRAPKVEVRKRPGDMRTVRSRVFLVRTLESVYLSVAHDFGVCLVLLGHVVA